MIRQSSTVVSDSGVPGLGATDLGATDLGATDLGVTDLGETDLGVTGLGAPNLVHDLVPLAPLLRRLYSQAPLRSLERFAVGRIDDATVDLSGVLLPPQGMRALADAILVHGGVRTLRLNRCGLRGAARVDVCRLLLRSTSLEDIELRHNGFSPEDATALLATIETAGTLRALALGQDPLGDGVARRVAALLSESETLQTLTLDATAATSAGLCAIANALALHNRSLTTLNLRRTGFDRDAARALANAFSRGCGLRTLRLKDCGLGDAHASALALGIGEHPHLWVLDVRGHALGDVGIAALADALGGHPTLRAVDLGTTRLHPAPHLQRRGAMALAEAVAEPRGALLRLSVDCADDATAQILVRAAWARGRPLRLLVGPHVRAKTRRRARSLGAGLAPTDPVRRAATV